MAPSSRAPTISRPFSLQKKVSTPASVTSATAMATPSRVLGPPVEPNCAETSMSRKYTKRDTSPTLSRATKACRKRGRQDTSDENGEHAKPRIRQRLNSMSSVETIRAHKSSRTSVVDSCGPSTTSLSHQSSNASMQRAPSSARPLTELNRGSTSVENTPPRTLRRVGTVRLTELGTRAIGDDGRDDTTSKYRSRIPLPASRSSLPVSGSVRFDDGYRHTGRPNCFCPPCHSLSIAELSIAELTAGTDSIAQRSAFDSSEEEHAIIDPIAGVTSSQSFALMSKELYATDTATTGEQDRWDLQAAFTMKHIELWDQPAESAFSWEGYLFLTDNQSDGRISLPPLNCISIHCRTHAYEGRFSLESNTVPTYSTSFVGASVDQCHLGVIFEPSCGIVVQNGWSRALGPLISKPCYRKKFWVPVPAGLFRKMETRMFRLTAKVDVKDRSGKRPRWATVHSRVELGDISHLRKQREMDGVARWSVG